MSETPPVAPSPADATNTSSLTEWRQAAASGTSPAMMIDIETFSTDPDALVLSMGVVLFNPHGPAGQVIDVMHVPLDLAQRGATTNLDTVIWWLGQTEAGKAMTQLRKETPLHMPEQAFEKMRMMLAVHNVGKDVKVWANSPSFDCVILRRLAEREGFDVPWSFRNERCFRTWRAEFRSLVEESEQTGAHDALEDALWQAKEMQRINKVLRDG